MSEFLCKDICSYIESVFNKVAVTQEKIFKPPADNII